MAKRKSGGGFIFNILNVGITVVMFALPTVALGYWYLYLRDPAAPPEEVVAVQVERPAIDRVMAGERPNDRSEGVSQSIGSVGIFTDSPDSIEGRSSIEQKPTETTPNENVPRVQREKRTWSDASDKFRVEARFDGIIGDHVKLHTADDRHLEVPVAKLSEADKEYLRGVFKENGMRAEF